MEVLAIDLGPKHPEERYHVVSRLMDVLVQILRSIVFRNIIARNHHPTAAARWA